MGERFEIHLYRFMWIAFNSCCELKFHAKTLWGNKNVLFYLFIMKLIKKFNIVFKDASSQIIELHQQILLDFSTSRIPSK